MLQHTGLSERGGNTENLANCDALSHLFCNGTIVVHLTTDVFIFFSGLGLRPNLNDVKNPLVKM